MHSTYIHGWEEILKSAEGIVGYTFQNPDLLLQALTHSSYSNEFSAKNDSHIQLLDNERFEFLGDAVIGLVVAQSLMDLFPTASEGQLSRWRSSLVSRHMLAQLSRELDIGKFMLLGRGEVSSGGMEKNSLLAALMEAMIGALFLDGGLDPVKRFLFKIYSSLFDELSERKGYFHRLVDKKTYLQEKTQDRFRCTPLYRIKDTWGLEHQKFFKVEIVIEGKVVAEGDGRSKKEAEQEAAARALELMEF